MDQNKLTAMTVGDLSDLLEKKELSSTEICTAYISKVKETDPTIQAFLDLDEKHVLDAAAEADRRRLEQCG